MTSSSLRYARSNAQAAGLPVELIRRGPRIIARSLRGNRQGAEKSGMFLSSEPPWQMGAVSGQAGKLVLSAVEKKRRDVSLTSILNSYDEGTTDTSSPSRKLAALIPGS